MLLKTDQWLNLILLMQTPNLSKQYNSTLIIKKIESTLQEFRSRKGEIISIDLDRVDKIIKKQDRENSFAEMNEEFLSELKNLSLVFLVNWVFSDISFSLFSFKTLSEATPIVNQKFRSTILNSKVSKQIHDQQETSLCWAFALSTMLRMSLEVFLKKKTSIGAGAPDLDFVKSNEFHKRLRSEIIMMPIPKPSVIKYKMIDFPNAEDFENEIIEKQLHNLKLAVLRVSYFSIENIKIL